MPKVTRIIHNDHTSVPLAKCYNLYMIFLTGRVMTPGCPEGWQRSPDGTRCFGLLFDHKNWQDARKACKVYGADLASFHSRYGFKITYKPLNRQCFLCLLQMK